MMRPNKLALFAAVLVASAACSLPDDHVSSGTAAVSAPPVYPLALGPTGSRYLVDQTGAPFLWSGDAAWSLIAQLTNAEVGQYLDDRKAKGFDVIIVSLIEHQFATNAPANIAGDAPFPGRPFVAPNEAYFTHADDVIRAAAARGITVLLAPLYLGYACDAEGWCAEVGAATTAELQAWGQYVGNRYRSFDNIVWLIGGDMDPTSLQAQVLAVVNGILSTDSRHLLTAHNDQTSARSRWPNQAWLTIDNVYSYNPALALDDRAVYSTQPAMPYFLIESNYENEHAVTAPQLRAQAYWTMLSGGMGQVFGNCPIWHMGSTASACGTVDWQGNLGATGSTDVMRFNQLFASRPWQLLAPDLDNTVMTAGAGSGATLATAARASDGATVIAYLPTARAVTIDLTKLSGGQVNAWWFAPSTGAATSIGTFTTTGTKTFTPSSGDWVLVIDDASRGFTAPGVIPVSAPPTIASAATASPNETTATTVVQVLGADDGGEASLVYRWSGTGPGTASFSPNATNAAKTAIATFTAAGQYTLTATITDGEGQSVTSTVAVTVDAVTSSITVSPAGTTVMTSATQAYAASARDQFGGALVAQPAFSWTSTGGTISAAGSFTAGTTTGSFAVTATSGSLSGVAPLTITTTPPAPDTVVDFESLADNAVLSSYGGITWGANWRVWAGGSVYTKNAYVNSTAKTEVTSTFTLPANMVLKSLRIAVGGGGTATSIKISSPGNAEQIYTDINGTYKTKTLGWTTPASVITVKITCATTDGASDIAFDTITYGSVGQAPPPNQAPTIAVAAAAAPSAVTGTTSALSVLGADDGGEAALAYTWAASTVPSGGAATFSATGTNAAKSTTATFTKAGTYVLTATARDTAGLAATSSVTVVVQATPTSLVVAPATASVANGASQTFTATVRDQFATSLATQPSITWSVTGGGTISNAGVFTATAVGGPFRISATAGALAATATVTVTATNAAPTIATAAAASPTPVTGATTAVSVLGADDAGEPALIYTWAATTVPAGGAATFSVNGTNGAKAASATFTKVGTYVLTATVRDAGGLQAASAVTVVVQPTATSIAVSPATAMVASGSTQAFTAVVRDQFAANLASQPALAWTVAGGGTISATGLFTATTSGGPFTVTATAGTIAGTASVTVSSAANVVVDFETLADNTALTSYGGITWGSSWRVWAGGSVYTKNAFINSTAKTEVTTTFTLPAGTVLKSLRIAVGSGGAATSIKISSPGNVEQVYTDINGTYKTKTLGWTTAAQTITVKVTCPTTDGASDVAFDTITYGP